MTGLGSKSKAVVRKNHFGISSSKRRARVASSDSDTNPEEGGLILRKGNEYNYHGVNIVCFREG